MTAVMAQGRPPGTGTLRCRRSLEADDPAWDAYVATHPDATFFHLAGWRRVIVQAFHHREHYLLAERGGVICGVLPLVHMRTRLFGNMLVSTPFCVYGGILADDDRVRAALEAAAADALGAVGADGLELRDRVAVDESSGWRRRGELYATFRRGISGDAEADLKAVPRKQRAMIRKGQQNGLVGDLHVDVDRLFPIYAESVRNLGTPVFSRRYFRLLAEQFAGHYDVVTVSRDGADLAGALSFRFRDEVIPYYGGGRAKARGLAANDVLYWEIMRRAGESGARVFDFGRSKVGTGAFAFKRNWGFQPQPLIYRYAMRQGRPIPEVNPTNPKYRLAIAAWRRLPLPVANFLGPSIVRGTG